jgi:hypothetical protein
MIRNGAMMILVVGVTLLGLPGCGSASSEGGPLSDPPSQQNSPPAAKGSPPAPPVVNAKAAPAVTPVADAPQVLSEQELAEGWIALFDGQSLFGWQAASAANWRVENGAIVVDSGEAGLLCTTTEFSDYELSLEFRCPAATNSGIFLHTPLKPADPARDCYELNIAGSDNPFPTGGLVGRAKSAVEPRADEWQTFAVALQGGHVVVKLNGQLAVDYTDSQPLQRGHIGLQLNKGKVEFRRIRLKPLSLANLLNGKDLAGWKSYPDQPSKFTITPEGWLNVKNGRGQLETENSYGDFALQLECITHAPQLNSGVFFRCIPGEFMNGYESQIHNGIKNGDRTQPVDCGTGGVFRRVNARLVVADDGKWFHKTLIVSGPHVATWVNGYQVTDWTDERAPHDNPRNGLRLKAGTLMLQGHDPTTDISFRNLRIAELAARVPPAP